VKERLLRLMPALNDDAEFRLAARMWTGDVAFATESEAVRVLVRDGRVEDIAPAPADVASMIRIAGPDAGWRKMLEPVPPPFYQDLFGAAAHHGFTIGGRIEDVGPYYPALRRMIELLRSADPA
jgi:hypothetical protein